MLDFNFRFLIIAMIIFNMILFFFCLLFHDLINLTNVFYLNKFQFSLAYI